MANGGMSASIQRIEEITRVSDDSRAIIYASIEKIKFQLEATQNWKGEDADSYRRLILSYLDKIYNTTKWINEVTYELKQYIEKLKRLAQERAEYANNIQN